jgi:hypothetical protein
MPGVRRRCISADDDDNNSKSMLWIGNCWNYFFSSNSENVKEPMVAAMVYTQWTTAWCTRAREKFAP